MRAEEGLLNTTTSSNAVGVTTENPIKTRIAMGMRLGGARLSRGSANEPIRHLLERKRSEPILLASGSCGGRRDVACRQFSQIDGAAAWIRFVADRETS